MTPQQKIDISQNITLNGVSFSVESKDGDQAYNVYCNEGSWRGVYDPAMNSLTPYKDDCGWMTKDQCRMKTQFNVKRDQQCQQQINTQVI